VVTEGGAVRICFLGGGAIGGILAGHLATVEGVEVSLVGRRPMVEAINRDGLRVLSTEGEVHSRPRAVERAEELGPQDYVFLTVKAQQVDGVLPALPPLLGPETVVLPPTTGIPYWFFHGVGGEFDGRRLERIDPGGRHRAAIDPARVLGVVYWTAAEVLAPGVVRHHRARPHCPIGEPDGSPSERALRLGRAMEAGGVSAPVSPRVRDEIWIKMVNSLCWNPVACLTLARNREVAASPEALAVVRRMMEEADAVGERLGLSIPVPIAQRLAHTGATAHRMSMLQDLEAGRALEFDVLAASHAEMRELAGLPTPTLDAVYGLMALRAAAHEGRRRGGGRAAPG
jgi:2-dehydropantoate 2-reductase